MEAKLVVFQNKEIRRTLHNNEWWFAIVDVVAALIDSIDPAGYVKDMRRRDAELAGRGQIATLPSWDLYRLSPTFGKISCRQIDDNLCHQPWHNRLPNK